MRRGPVLLAFGAFAAALGLAPARASAAGTPTTTAGTTTTGTTTTAPTPSYAPLANSVLPAGCVGAGAAAIVPPSHAPVVLGTPASNLGPSAYPASAWVVAFGSSTAVGSTCSSAQVTLSSVSLFGGAVTATSVSATNGRGAASGLEVDGTPVSAAPGQAVPVEGWGEVVLGAAVGRLTAPLGIRLLQAHDGLLPGTTVVVAFAAAPRPALRPARKDQASPNSRSRPQTPAKSSTETEPGQESQRPAPNFPAAAVPLLLRGKLTGSGRRNPVVSAAAQYLGVPYEWGGASPKTGFDCSGLVSYVFAQLGVSLPHYAAAQFHSPDGVWVAPNRLQPGDLVFFTGADGTRQAPGHVGIYVGGGYLIDAPHTGSYVRIDSLDHGWYAENYVGARRIVAHLDARRVLDVSKRAGPTSILLRMFPQQLALGTTTRLATVAYRSTSTDYPLWMGGPLGGVLLILLLAGAVVFHRRRRDPERPSEMPPA